MFPFRGTEDTSGSETVDMISPALCQSQTQRICLEFDYVIGNKPDSELRILTRCRDQDWGTPKVFNTPTYEWTTASVTLTACPLGDTQVGGCLMMLFS